MACNCTNRKKDLNYVRSMANKYVRITKESIQIYKIGDVYNFEPVNSERDNIIEIIKWVKE